MDRSSCNALLNGSVHQLGIATQATEFCGHASELAHIEVASPDNQP
ncbi:hypothetical protein RB4748 [Rhodopirellula baltica SH 1]|uniref:Uncharacterized protein n=1 Tax=Rhodopirellula baltica (strain DSM 10527 / NCIMB 13988 / SH1) TaxID=243090 RepID=Q7UHA9_RHOBA|nr:hypothetical protein RB4748 [Rhodopirellula baltica SH 1]